MIRTFLAAALALALAGPAAAECYADYKAKRDEPLKLHYVWRKSRMATVQQVLPKANWRQGWRPMAGRC